MRKLNKPKILSTRYKEWEEELESSGTPHPNYSSSNHRFYYDIVANLLNIQDGLCAYTEIRLCEKQVVGEEMWTDGRFNGDSFEFKGQLDHFDPSLKAQMAWLWDNFYVIDTDVNTKVKKAMGVDHILNPGTDDYDENRVLAYNCSTHYFIANPDLDTEEKDRVNRMIEVLGLNFGPIKEARRRFLSEKFKSIEFNIETVQSVIIDEFPTAFKFCIKNQN